MGPKTHGWDPKNYWMGPKRFFAKNMAARKLFYKKTGKFFYKKHGGQKTFLQKT